MSSTNWPASFWKSGLLCRCPACGQAPLFDGLLKVKAHCPACGANFANEDSGDGPAVFVILIGGAICVPLVVLVQMALKPPPLVLALFALPFTLAVCIALLRPFKALLFAAHWHHKAGEGRVAREHPRDRSH